MKVVKVESLHRCGTFGRSRTWLTARREILAAIDAVKWPPGSGKFTIYPQSGKKRGEGNGVKPIRNAFVEAIRTFDGWAQEAECEFPTEFNPGDIDALKATRSGPVAVEWETGNVSSCHRSLNKMTMLLHRKWISAGILIVPTRDLYRFLTDRISNFDELRPYFDFWRAVPVTDGVLEVIAVEHDATSTNVPRIPKGTDGRAAR